MHAVYSVAFHPRSIVFYYVLVDVHQVLFSIDNYILKGFPWVVAHDYQSSILQYHKERSSQFLMIFFYCAFLFHTLCHPFSRHDVPPISTENLDFKITWDFRSSIWTLCESPPFDTLCFDSYPYNQIPGFDHSLYLTFVLRHLPITSCSHTSCCQWLLSFPIFILFFQLI